jgi:predicted ATPase
MGMMCAKAQERKRSWIGKTTLLRIAFQLHIGFAMRLKVKNFGPIQEADVDFNRITVIIGKNNMGKSYLAQLQYAILESSRQAVRLQPSPFGPDFEVVELEYILTMRAREHLTSLGRRIRLEHLTNSAILENLTQLAEEEFAQRLQTELRLSLERTFGVKVQKLVNICSNYARLKWNVLEYVWVSVQISRRGTIKTRVTVRERGRRAVSSLESLRLLDRIRKARKYKIHYLQRVYREINRILFSRARTRWGRRAFYIPAGRGGLVESYETVVGGLVSLSPVAPVQGVRMPPLPGTAAQFYTVLLRLRGRKGPMGKIVTETFEEMLQGKVHLRKVRDQPKSRLVYLFKIKDKVGSTEIIHAASMIKELAPIYLILKELVDSGDYLLIEEPESHLHPGAQVRLARVFGGLTLAGVNILITTHSDIFLRAIGHFFAEHRINKAERQTHSLVTAYWLKEGSYGSVCELINIPKRGIFEDIPTFDEVVKDLYKEELTLEKRSKGE